MPGSNAYPNLENYPSPSFQTPATAPDVDPDEGAVVVIGLNPEWIPVVEGALDQLLLPDAWTGDHDTVILALNRASNLKMLVGAADVGEVPAPFWDEDSGDDSDDQAPIDDQPWYGQIVLIDDNLTFVENAFIYVVAGFIAYAGLPTAAISFVPLARNFVITMKSNPLGGIVRFLADATEIGRVDTYAAADGVVSAPVAMPPPTMGFVAEDVLPTLWLELLEDNPHDLPSVSMTLIRSRLSEADFSNPTIRYNPDTDQIEMTPDGGVTWNPAPGSDPRHSLAFLKPPVGGSSKRCDAAANMVKWLHDFIDQCLFDLELIGSVTTIINSILLSLNVLSAGFASFLEAISELAETISGIGSAALIIAFTSTEYDLLTCIFFCNVDSDGRVSVDALAEIQTEITAQLNTTAALVVNAILSLQGEIGLSNAGSVGSETGDCDGCACAWCYEFDFTLSDGGWSLWDFFGTHGVWETGIGWHSTLNEDDSARCSILLSFTETVITKIDVVYTADPDSGGGTQAIYDLTGGTQTNIQNLRVGNWSGSRSMSEIGLNIDSDCRDGCNTLIMSVKFHGVGDNPFGTDNC